MPQPKYYAVCKGRRPGIYTSWDDAKAQVQGFPDAVHKSFRTKEDALFFYEANCRVTPTMGKNEDSLKRSRDALGEKENAKTGKKARVAEVIVISSSDEDESDLVVSLNTEKSKSRHDETKLRAPILSHTGAPAYNHDLTRYKYLFSKTDWKPTYHINEAQCEIQSTQNLKPVLFHMYFDGGSRGNPGIGGCGAVILDQNKRVLWRGSKYLGSNITNNVAEYNGLIEGLEGAIDMRIRHICVYGDSNLIIKQLRKEYKVKDMKLQPLYKRAKALLSQFSDFNLLHIYRETNKLADQLANQAMNSKQSFRRAETS